MINNKLLKNKSIEELNIELLCLLKKYFYLRMKLSLNQLKNTHLISLYKKDIARIKTFLNIKEKNIFFYEKKKKKNKRLCNK